MSAEPAPSGDAAGVAADESTVLTVAEIVRETFDAATVVFDASAAELDYRAGQYLTVAVPSDVTGSIMRSYSFSSSPACGEAPAITIKRTPDGYASNWLLDRLRPGHRVRVAGPDGVFTPPDWSSDLLLIGGGSGITPLYSILKEALRRGTGRIVLWYANRDERSVIFARSLRALAAEHPDRFTVTHWLESLQGLPSREQLQRALAPYAGWESFLCGPEDFVGAVDVALHDLGVPRSRRHIEPFVSPRENAPGALAAVVGMDAAPAGQVADLVEVEITVDGQTHVFDDWPRELPLVDFMLRKGLPAPFACRAGGCGICVFAPVDGEVVEHVDNILTDAELESGLRLACQSRPVSDRLRVEFPDDPIGTRRRAREASL